MHREVCKDRGYCHYLGTCTDTVGKGTFRVSISGHPAVVSSQQLCVCRAAPSQDSVGELHRHFSCLPVNTQQMANIGWKCPQDWSMRENGIYSSQFLVSSDSRCHLRCIPQKAFLTSGEMLRHLRHRSGIYNSVQFCIAFYSGYSVSCNIFWSDETQLRKRA